MIVTAALAWYDEPVEFLDRCVRSLAPFCDRLVALDGRWEHFGDEQDAPAMSPPAQADVIRRAAADIALPTRVIINPYTWSSQVAKRDHLMLEAQLDSDWILVIDGDEHLAGANQPRAREMLDPLLAHTPVTEDVCEITLRPMNRTWPYSELPENAVPVRRVMRAGTRVPGPTHFAYRYRDHWLNGDTAHVTIAPARTLPLELFHDNNARPEYRRRQAKGYRRSRRELSLENWGNRGGAAA